MAVHPHQLVHPFAQAALNLQDRSVLHLIEQGLWDSATSHLNALGLQPDGFSPGPAMLIKAFRQAVLVMLCGGLWRQTQSSEAAAPVMGQPLKIHDRDSALLQGQEEIRFAGSGAASHQSQRP